MSETFYVIASGPADSLVESPTPHKSAGSALDALAKMRKEDPEGATGLRVYARIVEPKFVLITEEEA